MEQKKKRTLDIIKSHPEGVPVNSLNSIYGHLYKNGLSVRESGFSSLQTFVKSFGDAVTLFEKEKQIFVKVTAEDEARINMAAPALTTDGGEGKHPVVKANQEGENAQKVETVTSVIKQAEGKQSVVKARKKKKKAKKAKMVTSVTKQGHDHADDGNNIETLATNLQRMLMQRDPDSVGIPLDKLEGEYLDFFGKPLNVNSHSVSSIEDLVSRMSDRLILSKRGDCLKVSVKINMKERANTGDYLRCAANFSMSSVKDQAFSGIPDLKSRISLILEESEIITLSALTRRYSELFGTELQPEQYDFKNLLELLLVVGDGYMLRAVGSEVILMKRTEPEKPFLKKHVAFGGGGVRQIVAREREVAAREREAAAREREAAAREREAAAREREVTAKDQKCAV